MVLLDIGELVIVILGFTITIACQIFRKILFWRMSKVGGGSVFTVVFGKNGRKYVVLIRPSWKREFEEFGGKIDDGETGLTCAYREFEEEGSDIFEAIGSSSFQQVQATELMMRTTGTKGYLWTVAVLLYSDTIPEGKINSLSMMKFKDMKHEHKGNVVELRFVEVSNLYGKGKERLTSIGDWIPVSGRTRRLLSDVRIKTSLQNAKNCIDYHSSDSEAIFMMRKTPPLNEMV